MLFSLVLLSGCDGSSSFWGMEECSETTPVDADDASLGFDPNEVMALVSTALPTSIVWDEITAGGNGADLDVSISGVADDVAILDESECYGDKSPPLALLVPLEATLSMAKGEVLAEGLLTVAATGVDSLDLVELRMAWELPATLSGQYEADLTEHIETGPFPDSVLDGVYVTGIGAWPEAQLDIEIQSHTDDAISGEAVWRGHWQL